MYFRLFSSESTWGCSINGGTPKLMVYMFICLWTIPLSQYEGFRLPLFCSEGHFADIGPWAHGPRLFHIQISHLRVSKVRRRAWLQAFGAGSQHLAGWSQRTLRVKKIRDGEAPGGGDGALGVWESGSGGLIMVNNGYSCLIMAYHYYYGIIQ